MKNKTIFILLLCIFLLSGCSKKVNTNIVPTLDTSKATVSESNTIPEKTTDNANANDTKQVTTSASTTQPSTDKTISDKEQPETNNIDTKGLSTKKYAWYFVPKTGGVPSGAPAESTNLLKKYRGYYLGDTSTKCIYLTFDEGYENGYTSKILDILKANNVKAAFFVTNPYITQNKDLVKRMASEGHLVCNHSTTHPSMPTVTDVNKFNKELTTVENSYKSLVGKDMPKFFRPPMGEYSELSMAYTSNLGYKTIFWSFAYKDWDPASQPAQDYAEKLIKDRSHSGGIFLLHAVSKTNTNILDNLLKYWKAEGYQMKSLSEL